ncbi:33 kDa inner dynein arm light chain, axonemal-like isoform X1 [Anguilla rostrata]|uniref:33 kDa inner dynein arm light chain, axonemal-like isoform X1 n=1 Tax=Anguilla rostrata TaxID=7938 RepID=UPI0030CE692C
MATLALTIQDRSVAYPTMHFHWDLSSSQSTRPKPSLSWSPPTDELIRQETINCTDRGLLLLRVRDEISMCMAAYQTLDESSVAFGIRKVLHAEQGKAEMEKQIQDLEEEKRALERQQKEMEAECEAVNLREMERQVMEDKKHTEEIEFLKRTNQQLKFQLSGISQKK